MRFEDMDKREFDERLQEVLDLRNGPESDAQLCELAYVDEDAATKLRAAELIASPPSVVAYPTAAFADRILARIHEEDAAERRLLNTPIWKRKAGLYWGAGLVAAASIALLMGVWNSRPNGAQVAAVPPVQTQRNETRSTDVGTETLPSEEAQKVLMRQFAVEEGKVAQLRSGLNPFRSTLNVTLHVLRSTVPTRNQQPSHRPVEGKPSSALIQPRWIA